MKTLLILHFLMATPGAPPTVTNHPAGLMADHNTCTVAGAGMVIILEAANPGLTVAFSCVVEGPTS